MTAPADPACSHRPPCPGCPRFGHPEPPRPVVSRLEQLARDAGAELAPTVVGPALGFRHRARLAVRGRARSPKIGIFAAGTHDVVDIPRCPIHHPLVNEVARAVKAGLRSLGIPPYHERAGESVGGVARYLQVVIERSSQTAQIVLIFAREEREAARALAQAVEDSLPGRVHSVFLNLNRDPGNAILGAEWEPLSGPEAVCESLGGVDVFFPPGAFGQSHLHLADRLVSRVREIVPPGRRVAELYAGAGAIGLSLLSRAASVALNERDLASLRGLELGLARRPEAEQQRARIFPGDAAEQLEMLQQVDCAIVDPPRRGLDPRVADRIAKSSIEDLVYVSCSLSSFARDADVLAREGLALRGIEPFALFPHTEHVELVARFGRS